MATTPRLFVLNAPDIAADLGNMTFALFGPTGSTLLAATGTGIAADAAGYTATANYDLSWPQHAIVRWYHSAVEVASESFDVPDSLLTMALTEGYAAKGSPFTLAQALYELLSSIGMVAIVGAAGTTYKRDGTTPATTFTLDSASIPTTRKRAT